MQSRHVHVVIARPAGEVYEYAADPDHLSGWAAGLAQGEVTRDGDLLLVDLGRVER